MAHIRTSIRVNAPIEKVYALARDPQRWSTWFVGLSAPDDIRGHGEAGTMVTHKYTLGGFSIRITSRVVEDKAGPKTAHWRGTFDGPIEGQHVWTYTAEGAATEIVGEIDYTIPGTALKIDKVVIETLQNRAIAQSLANLKLLCEADQPAKVLP